jgi:hypothetical protein
MKSQGSYTPSYSIIRAFKAIIITCALLLWMSEAGHLKICLVPFRKLMGMFASFEVAMVIFASSEIKMGGLGDFA